MSQLQIEFLKFCKAILTLEAICSKFLREDGIIVDATIQRFEYTFDLVCKFLKEYFFENGIMVHYPKAILQEAFAVKLIDHEGTWIQMFSDRNMTPHTYDEKLANEIYQRIKKYVPEFKKLTQLNIDEI